MCKLLPALLVLAACGPAFAIDVKFDGYAELRGTIPGNQESWVDGGLGKLRYGSEDKKPELRLNEVVGQGVALITPEVMALAVVRVEPTQRTFFDFLEAYVRYRPVSTNAWRFSLRAGAFFPPVSLENTEIGWTSPWTLTPSAINTWIGEEVRIVGAEARVEYRSEMRTLSAYGSIYGWNDPAGVLIADRGWAFHDRVTGLIDRPREPDVMAPILRQAPPLKTYEVLEIDGRPGWYLGGSWDEVGLGHLDLLYYNNEADPSAVRRQIAWRTDFWNLGLSTQWENWTFLAQGMTGKTTIEPIDERYFETYFKSAYLLAGLALGSDIRIAGRFDIFSTEEERPFPGLPNSEHGNAVTFAVNYYPYDWLRLSGEAIRIDSTRGQRARAGLDPHAIENQIQFSARFYLP